MKLYLHIRTVKGNMLNASVTSKGLVLGSAHIHSNKE
jgi:hypothetical protein